MVYGGSWQYTANGSANANATPIVRGFNIFAPLVGSRTDKESVVVAVLSCPDVRVRISLAIRRLYAGAAAILATVQSA
jgi:hypothetical protein